MEEYDVAYISAKLEPEDDEFGEMDNGDRCNSSSDRE